jgi:hypothetical protein
MKDWIPLFQDLVWPIAIGIFIALNRKWFKKLCDAIEERIRAGSEVSIGSSGLKIGRAPELPDSVTDEDVIDDGYEPDEPIPAEVASFDDKPELHYSLSHTSELWKIEKNRPFYRIRITTHADSPEAKDKIEKVVYKLHPTFKNRIRPISSPLRDFLLKTNCWGEFTLKAEVYLKGQSAPILLSRYIELQA